MQTIIDFRNDHPRLKAFWDFGNRTLAATAIGAGIGAVIANHTATAAAIGPAAIMGAAAAFISKPADMLIDRWFPVYRVPDRDVLNNYSWKDKNNKLNPTLKLINHVVTNLAVWGGAVALGAVSLPVAGVVGGACIANSAINFSAKVLFNHKTVGYTASILIPAALKVGVIAGATTGLIFLGVVAPPVGITVGVVLGGAVVVFAASSLMRLDPILRVISVAKSWSPAVTLLPTSL